MPGSPEQKLQCRHCGAAIYANLPPEVDAVARPGAKRALLDGSFFQLSCPKCLQSTQALPRLFYRDAAAMLMAVLDPTESRQELFFADAVPAFRQGYSLRLAASPEALAETLRIFEDGLSDKVLEVWKFAHMERIAREYAGRQIEALRYAQSQGKYISFDLIANGKHITRLSLPRADYAAREQALAPYLRKGDLPGRYLRVDAGYLRTRAGKRLLQAWEAAQE